MMQFLAGLPLASHFEKSVSWEDFDEKSTDATGAILRRIADSVFLSLLESIAEDYGNSALTAIDSLTGEHLRKAPLTPELRLEIFRQAAPHSEVTPTTFRNAYRKVLDDKQVQELLRENSRFYDDIEGVSDDYLDNEDRE
jgi:hypothetical protein